MIALGLRVVLRGGRESAIRIAAIGAGVAMGVVLILLAIATLNGLHTRDLHSGWLATSAHNRQPSTSPAAADGLLWRKTSDQFGSQSIARIDVAATGPSSPVPPGIPTVPAAGQFYASPALATFFDMSPEYATGPLRVRATASPPVARGWRKETTVCAGVPWGAVRFVISACRPRARTRRTRKPPPRVQAMPPSPTPRTAPRQAPSSPRSQRKANRMPDIMHSIRLDTARSRLPKSFTTVDGIRRAIALTATLGLSAACWVIALHQMSGMDAGVSTRLGSFGFFIGVWALMMVAMMLPSAAPAVARRARSSSGVAGVLQFVTYLSRCVDGPRIVVYVGYRPHGTLAAGAVVAAQGSTNSRRSRRGPPTLPPSIRSGEFTLGCIGSSIGLMLALGAIGVMSAGWMAIIAALVLAQKVLPCRRAVDIPVALTLVGLSVLIILTPGSIPGLVPSGVMASM